MFERFSKAAMRAVHQAVSTAQDRGDTAVGTEHLLAGVAASPSPASELLTRLGASPQLVVAAMSDLDTFALASIGIDQEVVRLGPGPNEWPRKKRHFPFTGAAKHTLESALHEAVGLKHRHIGTEHFLLALSSTTNDDPARMILTRLGIDPELLRQQVLATLN